VRSLLLGAALAAWAPVVGAQGLARHPRDPRMRLPGTMAVKVPAHGPDAPYAAVLCELSGAATELYLRDQAGGLWRVERPRDRRRGSRLRRAFAFSLPPGRYWWVGFTRWEPWRRVKNLYTVLEAGPVPLEVEAGVATYAGFVRTIVEPRKKTRPWKRDHFWRHVHPDDFAYRFEVVDEGAPALERMAATWAFTRSGALPVVSGLLGPGEVRAGPATLPPGGAWGYRPARQ